jgi:hypothetical protein
MGPHILYGVHPETPVSTYSVDCTLYCITKLKRLLVIAFFIAAREDCGKHNENPNYSIVQFNCLNFSKLHLGKSLLLIA